MFSGVMLYVHSVSRLKSTSLARLKLILLAVTVAVTQEPDESIFLILYFFVSVAPGVAKFKLVNSINEESFPPISAISLNSADPVFKVLLTLGITTAA
jgi:hypothetical protein